MSFHLAAYLGVTPTPPAMQPVFLLPVTDMYLPSTPTGFLMPSPMKIVAAWAASRDTGEASPAGLASATINAPSLLRVAYPNIRPLSHHDGESTDPNVMNMVDHPLLLPASENVAILASVGAGAPGPGSEPIAALLWFCDELIPVPPGEIFTLRFAVSGAPATTPLIWSPVGTVVFDQSLPPGVYAVVGFEHWSTNAAAARLVFPGMHMRPGTLSMGHGTFFPSDQRTDRLFYEGGIGVYGSFSSYAPPSFEVFGGGGDTAHEGYLSVIRTGDIGGHPHQGAPTSGPPHVASR